MKIAYVYDAVYPWVKGGAERRIYELSRRLASRGHEVHCYGMKWWPGAGEIENEGVHLHGICPPMPLYRNGKRSIAEAAFFAGHLLALRSRCDVMDCQNFPYLSCFSAKLVSSLQGQRLFLTWHEVWGDYWQEYLGGLGRAGQLVEWSAAHLTARNIAVSKRTERDLSGLGARDIQIVPNGIDWQEIRRVPASELQSDVIYVGRLARHKNVDQLIRAVGIVKQQLPGVRALVIGDGPEMDGLKSLVRSQNLEENVRFLGFVEDYNEALALMKSSRVFVMPSTREGFGLAALEANACGLPVVTVKHRMNAVTDLVSENNGVVCSPTEKDLARAILSAHQKSTRMRGQCMEAARRYDWNEISLRAERVYEGKASIC
jgi:glycosyltransferase involved in cell wall biosynthesis